jgi:hypothetical protein
MIYHKHHIIPKHAGGTDEPSNLVLLSIEEHAQAHLNLYSEYGRREDKLAWLGLSKMISKQEIIQELTTLAGNKTVSMQVGIHDPNKKYLKQLGGKTAIKSMPTFTKNSKWVTDGISDTRIAISKLDIFLIENPSFRIGRTFSPNKGKPNPAQSKRMRKNNPMKKC